MKTNNKTENFIIDFFELMFLAESVIPNRPIARSMCFDNFSEVHYHKMSNQQREQFLNHVMNCPGFSLENEQCQHFFARFNPKNQFWVTTVLNKVENTTLCYLFEDEYRVSKNKFLNKDYIKSVVRIYDKEKIL